MRNVGRADVGAATRVPSLRNVGSTDVASTDVPRQRLRNTPAPEMDCVMLGLPS
jgi:hypothetical protein